jgi:hypothetical protein
MSLGDVIIREYVLYTCAGAESQKALRCRWRDLRRLLAIYNNSGVELCHYGDVKAATVLCRHPNVELTMVLCRHHSVTPSFMLF